HDDAGAGTATAESQANRRANPRRTRSAPVPLRYPYAHPPRSASRGAADGYGRACAGRSEERPMNGPLMMDRRRLLKGGGALIVSFSLTGAFAQDQGPPAAVPAPKPPGSLATSPYLDSWIRIDADGTITVFTGKAELGQGFKTAFQQIAAE